MDGNSSVGIWKGWAHADEEMNRIEMKKQQVTMLKSL